MKKIAVILWVLSIWTINSFASTSDWTTYTNSSDIRDLVMDDNTMWCATNGGLLQIDLGSLDIQKYTNIEGLADIMMSAVEMDHNGNIWLAFENGLIQRYDPEYQSWNLILDYEGLTINDVYAYGDSIFLSLNIGISLFDIERWEVKETYKIGNVRQLTIHNSDIWAATDHGVKKASLDFPNLIAPSAWTTYTQGLPDSDIQSIYVDDQYIAAGTVEGMAFFRDQTWVAEGPDNISWFGFTLWNNTLLATNHYGVYQYGTDTGWDRLGHYYSLQCMGVDSQDRIWVGHQNSGLYYYQQNSWNNLMPDGPAFNNFSAVKVDPDGRLWCASGIGGISMYNGEKWTHYNSRNHMTRANDFRDIEIDNQGRIWFAGYGSGIYIFTPVSQDSFTITNIYTERLASGSANRDDYVTITNLQLDSDGNMWILNYAAVTNRPLVVVDSTLNRWQYFSTGDGISSNDLMSLILDDQNRKWLCTKESGIIVYDDNNTPFNKSDDKISGTLTTADELVSNEITSLAIDFDQVYFIGTTEGINTYYSGKVSEYLDNRVINSSINIIVVDGVNNKWVGTAGGLSMLHSDGFDTTHYVSEKSPLVSDNVTSLSFNQDTGDLYIGTSNGLSCLKTPYKKPQATLKFVKGYPNPFILGGQVSNFYIDNLGKNSQVSIYTAEGFLVKRLSDQEVMGSRAVWNGRNDRGDYVASGIYIYQIITEDGLTSVGKVAVINP